MLKQLRTHVHLALDANDQSELVRVLNSYQHETLPWMPHPRTLTDIVRYVALLDRSDLDPRIKPIIVGIAYAYNILPSGR